MAQQFIVGISVGIARAEPARSLVKFGGDVSHHRCYPPFSIEAHPPLSGYPPGLGLPDEMLEIIES